MSISRDPKSIKAIAIDLDGTLLAPGAVLSERSIKAIEKCRQRGIKFIITSGRSLESSERFRSALGVEGPMVYQNGAMIVDMPKAQVLSIVPMDDEAAEFCVDLAREMGVYCQFYISDKVDPSRTVLMAERDCPERETYFKQTRLLAVLVDLKEALRKAGPGGCVKCMYLTEPEILDKLRPRLEERLSKSVYVARTTNTFLEIMNVKVSKGKGLKFVMERNCWKAEEVIAIGDEENDLPMFEVAGFSATPASAKDSMKAKADMVIGSNAEDGVAIFLEEFFGF